MLKGTDEFQLCLSEIGKLMLRKGEIVKFVARDGIRDESPNCIPGTSDPETLQSDITQSRLNT